MKIEIRWMGKLLKGAFALTSMLVSLVFGSQVSSAAFGVDVNVSAVGHSPGSNEAELDLSVNPRNRNNQVLVGHAPDGLRQYYMSAFYTLDGGSTWNQRRIGDPGSGLATDLDGSLSNFRADPTVAINGNEEVYLSYLLGTTRIACLRSQSMGAVYEQWSHAIVGAAPDPDTHTEGLRFDQPRIATGSSSSVPENQMVYIAYLGITTTKPFGGGVTDSAEVIYLIRSSDDGATFSSPVPVSDMTPFVHKPRYAAPAVGPDGEVYVSYMDQYTYPNAQIRVTRLDADGSTVSEDVNRLLVTTSLVCGPGGTRYGILAQPDRGIQAAPTLAVDCSEGQYRGRVYLVYVDKVDEYFDTDVMITYSSDGGENWSTPERIHNESSASQFHPALSVDPRTGAVIVAWYDARDDAGNKKVAVYLGTSMNGGDDWSEVRLSDGVSDQSGSNASWQQDYLEYIGTDAFNGVAYVAWSDNHLVENYPTSDNLDYFTDSYKYADAEWFVQSDYLQISDAVNVATAGDVITVESADTYGPVLVNKAIDIQATVPGVVVTGSGSDYGVVLADPGAVLEGLTIQGGSVACLNVPLQGGGRVTNCTLVPTSGTDYAAKLQGGSPLIQESSLQGGDYACAYMSTSGATLRSCTLSTSGGTGVELSLGNIEDCSISITGAGTGVAGAAFGGGGNISGTSISLGSGTGISGVAWAATIDRCSITMQNGTGISLDGGVVTVSNDTIRISGGQESNKGITSYGETVNDDILVGNCFISVPGGWGIYTETEDHEITECTIDNTKFAVTDIEGGIVRQSIATNCYAGFTTSNQNKAEYCIAWDAVTPFYPKAGTGSLNVDPLYCQLGGDQEFTLKVDSYGNPGNNIPYHYQIGAFPVGCCYGTLSRTSDFAGEGTLLVPGDATVPSGKTLTLGPGAILDVYNRDIMGTGTGDAEKVDVFVQGGMYLEGESGNTVKVQSQTSAEGDWNEIRVSPGATIGLEYADLQHGTIALRCDKGGHLDVTNSQFANNESLDLEVIGSNNWTTIADNTFIVGEGSGVHFTFGDTIGILTLTGNTITGTADSDTGLVIEGTAWTENGQRPDQDITGNWFSGFEAGAAMRITAGGRPRIFGNSITGSMRGVDIVRYADPPFVGDFGWSSSNPNTIYSNTVGFRCEGDSAWARVRYNEISGNVIGVETRFDATPDLGLALPTDPGYNNLEGNTNYCISNRNPTAPVYALGNYYGPCSGGIPPMCANGEVYVDGGLCVSPVSAEGMEIVAMPEVAPGAWLQYGVRPNPMQGAAVIHCASEKTGGSVRVRIFDVSGRLVKDFGDATVGPGGYSVRWNGDTDTGSRVRSGLYFVQFSQDRGDGRTTKLLVTR